MHVLGLEIVLLLLGTVVLQEKQEVLQLARVVSLLLGLRLRSLVPPYFPPDPEYFFWPALSRPERPRRAAPARRRNPYNSLLSHDWDLTYDFGPDYLRHFLRVDRPLRI
jgi:hypothetical protein